MSRGLIVLLFGVVLLAGWWIYKNFQVKEGFKKIKIGGTVVDAQIRDTVEGRNRGLSGVESLEDDEGMLFVFPIAAKYGFWMKEMKFDLDFVWINEMQVVEVTERVKAPKNGERLVVVKPKVAIKKMLEVNSGWVSKNKVKVGDRLELVW